MKKEIQPEIFIIEVSCSCGNKFKVNSCRETAIALEVCWNCHFAYTGEEKAKTTQGRSAKFNKRYGIKG
jgi:large subunit ribosomal protein L31